MNKNEIAIIQSKIYVFRGQQVMTDRDIAELYGVETRRLNEQVRRNVSRFPEEFCFQLTDFEFQNLMSQNATSSGGGTHRRVAQRLGKKMLCIRFV